MTGIVDHSWFIREYDRVVNEAGTEGQDTDKNRDAVAHAYATAVENGELHRYSVDLVEEGRDLFNKAVMPRRTSRRSMMRQNMEHLLAVIQGDSILDETDPILDWAFPLGDGGDKTLRYWTVEDLATAWSVRFSKSAQAATAAEEFYQVGKLIVDAMKRAGAAMIGDLPL